MNGLVHFALSAAATGTDTTAVDPITSLFSLIIPFALMFLVMWFILIRPQRKKEKALRNLVSAMVVGDTAVTIGGIVGKVYNIKDDEVTLSTSIQNTLVTVRRSAISSVIKPISD